MDRFQPPDQGKTVSTCEKMLRNSYIRDWSRLGLYSSNNFQNQLFKLTQINSNYSLCKTYPAIFLIPSSISDDSIRKFSKLYRNNRIPLVTWRHMANKTLLIRGAAYNKKSVIDMLRNHSSSTLNTKSNVSGLLHIMFKCHTSFRLQIYILKIRRTFKYLKFYLLQSQEIFLIFRTLVQF